MRLPMEVEPQEITFDGLAVRVRVREMSFITGYVRVHGYDTSEDRREREEAVRTVDVLREEDVVRVLGRFVAAAGRGAVELVHAADRF